MLGNRLPEWQRRQTATASKAVRLTCYLLYWYPLTAQNRGGGGLFSLSVCCYCHFFSAIKLISNEMIVLEMAIKFIVIVVSMPIYLSVNNFLVCRAQRLNWIAEFFTLLNESKMLHIWIPCALRRQQLKRNWRREGKRCDARFPSRTVSEPKNFVEILWKFEWNDKPRRVLFVTFFFCNREPSISNIFFFVAILNRGAKTATAKAQQNSNAHFFSIVYLVSILFKLWHFTTYNMNSKWNRDKKMFENCVDITADFAWE